MTTLILSIVIFSVTYAIIISEKVHRTVVALAGALAMILVGVLSQHQAVESIDFNTLGLLIGMMIIVGIARDSGLFQAVALWTAKVAKGRPVQIFLLLGLIIAVFSSLLDNVTTVLLMVPVIFVLASNLKLDPKPFLIGAILLSNIGGAMTLIGDPPNILIGSAAGITFSEFLVHLGPIGFVTTLVTLGLLYLLYRKQLVTTPEMQARVAAFNPREAIVDRRLLHKSLFVLGLVVLGFCFHSVLGLEGATVALVGAALFLLLTIHDPEEHLRSVEWTTIFFFIGLFVLVHGLEVVGVLDYFAEHLAGVAEEDPQKFIIGLLWGSAFFSAAVDNIPFVATMIPVVQNIGEITGMDLKPVWWALALGADFGGNATLVGASANVIVSGMAEREGHKIGFLSYMKVAVPLTIVALVLATVYLWFRYLT